MANLKYFNNTTASWEEIKVSTRLKDLYNTKKLTQDQSYVEIGVTSFNPNEDVLFTICNSTWLQKDEDYVINGGLLRIESKDGSNWKSGTTFNFVVLKNVDKDALPSADGSLIQDGSITISKLATTLQTYINKIGVTALTTTATTLSDAINELNKKITDISLVIPKNLITNGSFERFANTSMWADDWTGILGTGTNSVGRDVLTYYSGGSSQYLTKATANVADTMSLYQDITNVDVINFLKGKTINLQIFMKSLNAGQYGIIQCRDSSGLAIAGGNVSTNTHTGAGTWQSLTCKCIVPSNTVSIRVYGCYYSANTGTGVVYTDSVKLQVGEIPMPIKEIEFQKDTSINVTTIPIKTTISDTDKRVIHSVTLRGLMPSDKVLLLGQFEVTNPQTYTIGVGKYIIRASNDTAVSGTDVFPSAPNMENITADIHHKVFQMLGVDTTHGGGAVTYNIIGYAVSDSAGAGHTCTVESGYGALYALIL